MNQVKATFGLTPKLIETIEKEIRLSHFEGAMYSHAVWQRIGQIIGWEPLTAALWYFKAKAAESERNTCACKFTESGVKVSKGFCPVHK